MLEQARQEQERSIIGPPGRRRSGKGKEEEIYWNAWKPSVEDSVSSNHSSAIESGRIEHLFEKINVPAHRFVP